MQKYNDQCIKLVNFQEYQTLCPGNIVCKHAAAHSHSWASSTLNAQNTKTSYNAGTSHAHMHLKSLVGQFTWVT